MSSTENTAERNQEKEVNKKIRNDARKRLACGRSLTSIVPGEGIPRGPDDCLRGDVNTEKRRRRRKQEKKKADAPSRYTSWREERRSEERDSSSTKRSDRPQSHKLRTAREQCPSSAWPRDNPHSGGRAQPAFYRDGVEGKPREHGGE